VGASVLHEQQSIPIRNSSNKKGQPSVALCIVPVLVFKKNFFVESSFPPFSGVRADGFTDGQSPTMTLFSFYNLSILRNED